jgi:hypothetical protein
MSMVICKKKKKKKEEVMFNRVIKMALADKLIQRGNKGCEIRIIEVGEKGDVNGRKH